MDFVKDFYGYAQIHCPTFTNMVSAGKVQTVQGEIQRFTQDGVILKDGSKLEADVVVLGTGFLKKYAFFDAAMGMYPVDCIYDVEDDLQSNSLEWKKTDCICTGTSCHRMSPTWPS